MYLNNLQKIFTAIYSSIHKNSAHAIDFDVESTDNRILLMPLAPISKEFHNDLITKIRLFYDEGHGFYYFYL